MEEICEVLGIGSDDPIGIIVNTLKNSKKKLKIFWYKNGDEGGNLMHLKRKIEDKIERDVRRSRNKTLIDFGDDE